MRFNAEMKTQIQKLVSHIGGDGHTIWKQSVLADFPESLQERFITTLKSDFSDYKSTIYDNTGKAIPSIKGFYGLTVLTAICNDLGLEYEAKIGRGFQAQVCTEAINKWLNK